MGDEVSFLRLGLCGKEIDTRDRIMQNPLPPSENVDARL
jgi:hypothetical protein